MITQAALIEREQSQIEYEIAQRLLNMETAEVDTGITIEAQTVVDAMYELDPDRFILGIYLCTQQREPQIKQGRDIMSDLRKTAINHVIRGKQSAIYRVARDRVEADQPMGVTHAVA